MLMITPVRSSESTQTLRLEGKLLGPWVGALRSAVETAYRSPGVVQLDLTAVTFVDAAGTLLLIDLVRQGATVVACSGYVAELLKLER